VGDRLRRVKLAIADQEDGLQAVFAGVATTTSLNAMTLFMLMEDGVGVEDVCKG
jgi:hypothetical protein